MNDCCPILGFAAYSGTGKTTLLRQLIPLLRQNGLVIGVIKHTHHDIELDKPGKDSFELRHAGAYQTLLAGPQRWQLVTEAQQQRETSLDYLLRQMDHQQLDLVLVEGFRHETIPKIELHRNTLGHPWLYPDDKHVMAIACDDIDAVNTRLPVMDINQPAAIAEFIRQWLTKQT